jgi:hypothetical protein
MTRETIEAGTPGYAKSGSDLRGAPVRFCIDVPRHVGLGT